MAGSKSKLKVKFGNKTAMLTAFQWKVLQACAKIPKGKTATYGQIAKGIGKPGAMRAVGSALAANPFAPQIPCHRVIRGDGKIGNYSAKGGSKAKSRMLHAEGAL